MESTHSFPKLEYKYNSLEPYIDKKTMEIHYNKHHKAYFDKFISAIKDYPELNEKPIEEILANINKIPEKIRQTVINAGGGYFNHSFFWKILEKNTSFNYDSRIGWEITNTFGNFDNFKEHLSNSALNLFGSGWVWLTYDKKTKKIEIMQTKNQDSPISIGKIPLLAIDLWEHGYYLKYQNKRQEYIENFFNVINWKKVNDLFIEAQQ